MPERFIQPHDPRFRQRANLVYRFTARPSHKATTSGRASVVARAAPIRTAEARLPLSSCRPWTATPSGYQAPRLAPLTPAISGLSALPAMHEHAKPRGQHPASPPLSLPVPTVPREQRTQPRTRAAPPPPGSEWGFQPSLRARSTPPHPLKTSRLQLSAWLGKVARRGQDRQCLTFSARGWPETRTLDT